MFGSRESLSSGQFYVGRRSHWKIDLFYVTGNHARPTRRRQNFDIQKFSLLTVEISILKTFTAIFSPGNVFKTVTLSLFDFVFLPYKYLSWPEMCRGHLTKTNMKTQFVAVKGSDT